MVTEELENELIQSIRPNLSELLRIWDYVGYSKLERSQRIQHFVQKLQNLLCEVIKDENSARLLMEQKIDLRRREIADMCQQLGLAPFLPERGLTSSELMRSLDEKAEELIQQKSARCERYCWLRSKILHLNTLLGGDILLDISKQKIDADFHTAFPPITKFIRQSNGTVHNDNNDDDKNNHLNGHESLDPSLISSIQSLPDQISIEKLAKIHEELQSIYTPLAVQHTALRDDIARVAADIYYQPQSDQEAEILTIVGLKHLCKNGNTISTPGVVRRANDDRVACVTPTSVRSENSEITTNGLSNHDTYEPVVNKEILRWLTDWRLRLVKEKARLVGTCEELRAYLLQMWKRLDKPELEQKEFLEAHSGYKPETLEALQDEVDRCQQMKWENMQTYVTRLQNEAIRLASLCCLDEKIIQLPNECDKHDPEVLVNHLETILEQLNQTYYLYRPVYECIAVYDSNWKQLIDVEARLKDPSIFSNRGGILLKTEKEKKRLLKEVERTEKEALSAIEQYEMKSSSHFILSNGKTFTEHIQDRWNNYKTLKDTSKSRRSIIPSSSNNSNTNSPVISNTSGNTTRPTSANLMGSPVAHT
ncbi:hypothetical protein MN116_004143 [Schistosoma mekongi]|uniref:Protein regulator of cytokinesis 1 n=1 Tax=Schistosoma mekongi TaxID=38744 RepID=A0AAE1ZF65_SCHME|nr:hypothetical protein MN116_004143 [Schistosoma mekongi]